MALTPSHGHPMTAFQRPYSEHKKTATDKPGHEWKMVRDPKKRAIPYCLIDTNYWKSFAFSRLATAMGGKAGLDLFGDQPERHRLLSQHLTSEYRVAPKPDAAGRKFDRWELPSENPDNDWWDCLVGAYVAASIEGVTLEEHQTNEETVEESGRRQWDQFLARAKARR
jgi:hypothetical protein